MCFASTVRTPQGGEPKTGLLFIMKMSFCYVPIESSGRLCKFFTGLQTFLCLSNNLFVVSLLVN